MTTLALYRITFSFLNLSDDNVSGYFGSFTQHCTDELFQHQERNIKETNRKIRNERYVKGSKRLYHNDIRWYKKCTQYQNLLKPQNKIEINQHRQQNNILYKY